MEQPVVCELLGVGRQEHRLPGSELQQGTHSACAAVLDEAAVLSSARPTVISGKGALVVLPVQHDKGPEGQSKKIDTRKVCRGGYFATCHSNLARTCGLFGLLEKRLQLVWQ